VPLPYSKRQIDLLGERLAAAETTSDDDSAMLQQVLDVYDREALRPVERRLLALGYTPTTRVKTTGTLIEKLRREQGMKLSRVQDVAGARILVDGTRRDQDDVVARIVAAFGGSRPPNVRDRRAFPSSGYRAVHVVVFEGGLPVEIQLRTLLQDAWAQIFERLGDRWGRGIRYGEEPNEPDRVLSASSGTGPTRREFFELMQDTSEVINRTEEVHVTLLGEKDRLALRSGTEEEYQALKSDFEDAHTRFLESERVLAATLHNLAEAL
jgi:hypothetical protein